MEEEEKIGGKRPTHYLVPYPSCCVQQPRRKGKKKGKKKGGDPHAHLSIIFPTTSRKRGKKRGRKSTEKKGRKRRRGRGFPLLHRFGGSVQKKKGRGDVGKKKEKEGADQISAFWLRYRPHWGKEGKKERKKKSQQRLPLGPEEKKKEKERKGRSRPSPTLSDDGWLPGGAKKRKEKKKKKTEEKKGRRG